MRPSRERHRHRRYWILVKRRSDEGGIYGMEFFRPPWWKVFFAWLVGRWHW